MLPSGWVNALIVNIDNAEASIPEYFSVVQVHVIQTLCKNNKIKLEIP